MPLALTPRDVYTALRNQLGSIRRTYLAGNRIPCRHDFQTQGELVLLIQGFFQTRNMWRVMEQRLRRDGFSVMSFNLGGLLWNFNTHSVDRSARLIANKIEQLAIDHGFERLHIVAHSKGGLIARRFIQHYRGHRRVKSLITLGTPHAGARLAWLMVPFTGFGLISASPRDLLPRSRILQDLGSKFPPDIPLTSIFSPSDAICPAMSARAVPHQRSTVAIEVTNVGHSQLAWHPMVYSLVLERLRMAG